MRRSRRTTAAVAGTALALALVAGACSSDDGDDDAAQESTTESSEDSSTTTEAVNAGATVEVTEFDFEPDPVTIAAGETVTWENVGSSRHTVTATSEPDVEPLFKSPPVQPESTFVQVFNDPGTYDYFCSIHPDRMSGQIVVE